MRLFALPPDTINLATLECFVGLNLPFEKDTESKSDTGPVERWPRNDAEAKLIAAAIATYDFNNYEIPKLYQEEEVEVEVDKNVNFKMLAHRSIN